MTQTNEPKTAQLCPVCGGSGKVPVIDIFGYQVQSTAGPQFQTCHGCYGQGWVRV